MKYWTFICYDPELREEGMDVTPRTAWTNRASAVAALREELAGAWFGTDEDLLNDPVSIQQRDSLLAEFDKHADAHRIQGSFTFPVDDSLWCATIYSEIYELEVIT